MCGTGFKNCKTGDFKEPDYIDADIFTPIVKIGEPKVSADKELEPNYLGEAIQGSIPSILDDMNIDESHGCKIDHGLFCVTGKDLDCIGIDDLYLSLIHI